MPLSLKPEHLRRYKDVALLLVKHGRGDLVDDAAKALLLPGQCREDADQAGFQRAITDVLGQHQELALRRPQA